MGRKAKVEGTLRPDGRYDEVLTEADLRHTREFILRMAHEVPPLDPVDPVGLALEGMQAYLELKHLPRGKRLVDADSAALRTSTFRAVQRADEEALRNAGFLPRHHLPDSELSGFVQRQWASWYEFMDGVRALARNSRTPPRDDTREGRLLRHYRRIWSRRVQLGPQALNEVRSARITAHPLGRVRAEELTDQAALADFMVLTADGGTGLFFVDELGFVGPGVTQVRDAIRREEDLSQGETAKRITPLHGKDGKLLHEPSTPPGERVLDDLAEIDEVRHARSAVEVIREALAQVTARQGRGPSDAVVAEHYEHLERGAMSLASLSKDSGIPKATLGDALVRVRGQVRRALEERGFSCSD